MKDIINRNLRSQKKKKKKEKDIYKGIANLFNPFLKPEKNSINQKHKYLKNYIETEQLPINMPDLEINHNQEKE